MKRIICLLMFSACLFSFTHAQQIIIKGKYNGKMLTVKAQRAPGGDIIESISYAPLEELKSEVANLKSQRDEWKKKYEKAIHNGPSSDTVMISSIRRRLDAVTSQLEDKENALNELQKQITVLQNQLQSSREDYEELKKRCSSPSDTDLSRLQDSIRNVNNRLSKTENKLKKTEESLAKTAKELENAKKKTKGTTDDNVEVTPSSGEMVILKNRDLISADVFFGASYIYNNLTSQSFWSRTLSGSQKYHLTLTHYFSINKPWAMTVGLGVSNYRSKIFCHALSDTTFGQIDVDGDVRDIYYKYRGVNEQVTLTYLDIPLLLHIGNSYTKRGVQAWAELGFTVGINISKSFEGSGTYDAEAYYPEWNVTVDNNPELDLYTDADIYPSSLTLKTNAIVLWANAAIGMYIPFNDVIGLNLGVRVDYSITPLATNDKQNGIYYKEGPNTLLGNNTRSFSAGANLGLLIRF